jgi:hypothetical protein
VRFPRATRPWLRHPAQKDAALAAVTVLRSEELSMCG